MPSSSSCAAQQGNVPFGGFASELAVQVGVGARLFRDDHATRREAVESMEYSPRRWQFDQWKVSAHVLKRRYRQRVTSKTEWNMFA